MTECPNDKVIIIVTIGTKIAAKDMLIILSFTLLLMSIGEHMAAPRIIPNVAEVPKVFENNRNAIIAVIAFFSAR